MDEKDLRNVKKSKEDRNGIIESLVVGFVFLFLTYQTYNKIFNFALGKIVVYIFGLSTIISFAVFVSCFFNYKESKKIEKLDEEARREERELSEIDPEKRVLRAEKMFRVN